MRVKILVLLFTVLMASSRADENLCSHISSNGDLISAAARFAGCSNVLTECKNQI